MRILVWSTFFSPHVGGYEKNVLELSRRLVQRGHQVAIVTCRVDNSPVVETISSLTVIRLPSLNLLGGLYPVPSPWALLLFFLSVESICDVAITQTRFFALSLAGAAYSKLYGIPLIHVERGSGHVSIANSVIRTMSRAYDHSAGRWVVRRAKAVVGVSTASCEFAEHLGARGAVRIPNGICPTEGNGQREQDGSSKMVLYVGRLIQAKGVQDLILAFRTLTNRSKDKWCSLAIVGDGPYKARLTELAGSTEGIRFYGELVGEPLSAMYRAASVFVNPSYSEGLPTAVMEAVAAGVPVVATDVGGTGEIVQSGTAGLLVKPNNVPDLRRAIAWVLSNEEAAHLVAASCRERLIRGYSWDRVIDQYCNLLESVRAPR